MTYRHNIFPYSILLVFMISAAVWDFRPMGQRLFDLVSLTIAAGFILIRIKDLKKPNILETITLTFLLIYCAYGYYTFGHLSSIAIAVYSVLFILGKGLVTQINIFPILKIIYLINIVAFLAQMALYHGLDFHLDFQTLFGATSRNTLHTILGLQSFRPSGLFSEPHNYCIMILMLNLLTLGKKEFEKINYLASLTLLLSLSIWGMIVGLVLPMLTLVWLNKNIFTIVKKYFLIILILMGCFFPTNNIILNQPIALDMIKFRVQNLFVDHSFKERFFQHTPQQGSVSNIIDSNKPKNIEKSSDPENKYFKKFIGHGLSTYPFVNGLALNSYSFIFSTTGIIGALLFIIIISKFSLHLYRKNKSFLEISSYVSGIILLLASYPLITYAFFWIFLTFSYAYLSKSNPQDNATIDTKAPKGVSTR